MIAFSATLKTTIRDLMERPWGPIGELAALFGSSKEIPSTDESRTLLWSIVRPYAEGISLQADGAYLAFSGSGVFHGYSRQQPQVKAQPLHYYETRSFALECLDASSGVSRPCRSDYINSNRIWLWLARVGMRRHAVRGVRVLLL